MKCTDRRLLVSCLLAVTILVTGVGLFGEPGSKETTPTFESLKALIEGPNNITSIDELLGYLPVSFRSGYTLVHSSRSRQGSSYENPRVIMYGKDARLIIAFTGSPDQEAGNDLEIIQWRDDSKTFEMRMIQFPGKQGGKVRFSEANPESCLACHQNPPRPNWEPYKFWPGTFGEYDDMLLPPKNFPKALKEKTTEALSQLINKAPSHTRYRHLENLKEHYSTYDSRNIDHFGRFRGLPNLKLTRDLTLLNSMRIARQLMNHPKYETYKFLIAAVIAKCPQYREQLGKSRGKIRWADGSFKHLEAVNKLLSLELPLNLENFSTAFKVEELSERYHYPYGGLFAGPFESGFGEFENVLSLGLSVLDKNLRELTRNLPREDKGGFFNETYIDGVRVAPFKNTTPDGTEVKLLLCKKLSDAAAKAHERKDPKTSTTRKSLETNH